MDWLVADWPAPPSVKAVTTYRFGGISQGPYCSFNLGHHVGDDPSCVLKNRKHLKQELELPNHPVWLNQVHGANVIQAGCYVNNLPADAGYTRDTNVVCTVMTADCLPILIAEVKGRCIAAVHGGWRSMLAGVIRNTIEVMGEKDLVAWLGPAIGPEVFEVGQEVRAAFVDKEKSLISAFTKGKRGRWLADIYQIARILLGDQGVKEVYGGGFCTYTDADRFFSYRRDGITGRMATLIWYG